MRRLYEALKLPDPASWRQAVRVTSAAILAYGATGLVGLQHGYWAVITCLVIVQGSLGATINAGLTRVAGTAAGAVVGGMGALFLRLYVGVPEWIVLLIVIIPLALLASSKALFRLGPLTGALVLLLAGSGSMGFAFSRVAEIALGTLIGVLVSVFVLPERATAILVEHAASILEQLAALTLVVLTGDDPQAHDRVALKLRAGFAQLQNDLKEVHNERNAHLLRTDTFPERLLRHLQRLRTDVSMLGRAAGPGASQDPHLELAERIKQHFLSYAAALRYHTELPEEPQLNDLLVAGTSDSPLAFALLTLQVEFRALHEILQQRPHS